MTHREELLSVTGVAGMPGKGDEPMFERMDRLVKVIESERR